MSDITLILDRKELVVRMESKSIRMDRPDGPPERIPLKMIARVIVMGSPMVSCGVWRALAEQNIPAILLPSRGGGAPAYTGSGLSATVFTRMDQYAAAQDERRSLTIAKWLVDEKLKGQESVLRKLGNNSREIESLCKQIINIRKKLFVSENLNSLMGHEGAAASAYFRALALMIPEKWQFTGRNRRPPRDPVNSLLSLSYTLAQGEVCHIIQRKGLDPSLGFLHSPKPGRESLVLDILEPLRPDLDVFVLYLIKETLNLKHFIQNGQDGCLLTKKGRSAYFKEWASWQEGEGSKTRLRSLATNILNELISFFKLRNEGFVKRSCQ